MNLLDQDSYQNLDKDVKTKETSTDDMSILNIYNSKKKIYHQSLKWFSVFMLYGIIGGMFINAISKVKLLNFDMMFNILISPIIYYHSPRNILTKISLKQFIIFYTIPFILGLFFRFFDEIPILNNFILDPDDIKTTEQIVLLVVIIIGILLISFIYIYFILEIKFNKFIISIGLLLIGVADNNNTRRELFLLWYLNINRKHNPQLLIFKELYTLCISSHITKEFVNNSKNCTFNLIILLSNKYCK